MSKQLTHYVFRLLFITCFIFAYSCSDDDDDNIKVMEIITEIPADITSTSVVIEADINNGSDIVKKGICWSEVENPTIADFFTSLTGDGDFFSLITGLKPNTTYYARAYVTNSLGTVYGNQVTFTTQKRETVSIVTSAVSDITDKSAVCGGVIAETEVMIIDQGICWSPLPTPTVDFMWARDLSGNLSYSCDMSDLKANTTYYVRAWVSIESGLFYGNTVSFTTLKQE